MAGKRQQGSGAHSKLPPTQPANFWAAARHTRGPELSRSAEPSRRGCPGGSSPGGREEGTSRPCPRNPPAPAHRDTCPSPGDRSLPQCHPATYGRGETSSHGRWDGAAAVPAGTWGGEAGARHPAGGSLRGSLPLYLRRAALRTDQRRSAWRTGSAPAGLSRGRVVSDVLGVVGGGRGEPRAGHSADQGAESRHSAPGSGSLSCQLQLGFKRLPVSSSRGVLVLGGGA